MVKLLKVYNYVLKTKSSDKFDKMKQRSIKRKPINNGKSREERVEELAKLITGGATFLDDLIQPKRGYSRIKQLAPDIEAKGLKVPPAKYPQWHYENTQRDPGRDDLIAQGLHPKVIAKMEGVTRAAIVRYISATGQKEFSLEMIAVNSREEEEMLQELSNLAFLAKDTEDLRGQMLMKIIGGVTVNAYENASEVDLWSLNKTELYYERTPQTTYTFHQLSSVFKAYRTAQLNDEKLSLKELGAKGDIHTSNVGGVLEKVGLEPFYGKRQRKITPPFKKEALKRALRLPIAYTDISHFLELPEHGASGYYAATNTDLSKRPVARPIKDFGVGRRKLTFKAASQIYEALDQKLSEEEAIEFADTSKQCFNHAVKYRPSLEKRIKGFLKKLYLGEEVTQPWVNFGSKYR